MRNERESQTDPFSPFSDAVTQRNYSQGQYVGTIAYFYTRDHLGSIREMFTGGGTVVARYDYDPYGRSTTVLGTTPTDFNFTGLYRHLKSNLDLAVFRAYDPDLGRWLSRDPIGEVGGVNLYAYVRDNPIYYTDRVGRNPIVVGAAIGTFIEPGGGTIIGAGIGVVVTIFAGAAIYDHLHNAPDKPLPTGDIHLNASFPPGYWPGDRGAEEWGRRNGVDPREARGRFHGIKQGCPGSKATDDYGVNPETGDVIDPEGDNAGNLGEAKSK